MTRALVHKASSATAGEIMKISCQVYATHINVSQETRRASILVHGKMMVKINLAVTLLLKLCNSELLGDPNSPCDSLRIMNINKGVTLVVSKQKLLQLNFVLLAPNTSSESRFCGRA